ncbi:hypothetical protein pdam_00006126 [Pocillopora damicornis]|uniref:Uncharacterized protein n=1 Tax=Pocillopora damicornis TaxID=46731 RepID=A0A3M6TDJ9_POCDA|nr:hypothetical protein pdam_00006126 [Pocillopora damicornis]
MEADAFSKKRESEGKIFLSNLPPATSSPPEEFQDENDLPKVAGRVLDKNYTRIGVDIDVQATLDSDIYNPEYNCRTEYRDPVFPQSCTLMLKVYTVDRISKTLCCVGYGFLPIFVEVGTTKQPSVSSSNVKVGLDS